MTTEMSIRLENLMNDEQFAETLMNAGSTEKAIELIRANGIEINDAEIREITRTLVNEDGELADEVLDAVAGGKVTWKELAASAVLVAAGGAGYLPIAGLIVYGYLRGW